MALCHTDVFTGRETVTRKCRAFRCLGWPSSPAGDAALLRPQTGRGSRTGDGEVPGARLRGR